MSARDPGSVVRPSPSGDSSAAVHRYADDASWQELAGYSRAVRSGDLIAVSGTTSSAPGGEALYPGDTYRQTLDAAQRAVRAVEALGGTVPDVVRTRVLLGPQASWEDAARAHKDVFDAARPANTMVYVAGLIGDGLLVEVEVEARTDNAGSPVAPAEPTDATTIPGSSGDAR